MKSEQFTLPQFEGKTIRAIGQKEAHDGLVSYVVFYFTDGTSVHVSSTGYPDGSSAVNVDVEED